MAAHATKLFAPIIRIRACHSIFLTLSVLTSRLAAAQGAVIAPTLISVSPVRSQVGTPRFNASPIGISVDLAEAPEADSSNASSTAPETLPGTGR